MPTYDYVCSSCGHRMEVVHGVHAHGPSACPVCGGSMRKAFAPPAVHFKGSGWAKKERASSAGRARSSRGAGSSGDADAPGGAGSGEGASDTATPAGDQSDQAPAGTGSTAPAKDAAAGRT